jgi:hypothetical protein
MLRLARTAVSSCCDCEPVLKPNGGIGPKSPIGPWLQAHLLCIPPLIVARAMATVKVFLTVLAQGV